VRWPAAWQGKELLRAVYRAVGMPAARAALERLLPLVRWRPDSGVIAAGPHRPGLGSRDPGLPRHRRVLQRPHRGRQPAHREGQAGRPRLSQLRQLPAAAAVALRRQLADAPDGEAARPLPTLGGREAVHETLRRLIGSSVVVGPANRSRRHEGPSRMVVSRRSGESRPPRWAARLQARVGSGSASPPRFEPTVLASPRSLSQFGLARLVSAGRRARCCHAEGAPVGAIGPNFGGTLDRCRSVPGSATQTQSPPGRGLALMERFASYRCAAVALRRQVADLPNHKNAKPPHAKQQLRSPARNSKR
jgi:Arc/MetJ family transcription regulator